MGGGNNADAASDADDADDPQVSPSASAPAQYDDANSAMADSAGCSPSTTISFWQRPDRQRFGQGNAPFIAFQPTPAVSWYTLADNGDGATTVVASQVTTLPGSNSQTATVGGKQHVLL